MEEILASQKVMLERRGEKGAGIPDDQMAKNFELHLTKVNDFLANNEAFDVLYISYNEILQDPKSHAKTVNDFLGGILDPEKMAQVVENSLYRQRKT